MNAATDLAARLQSRLAENTSVPIIYVIRPGDTLSHIVQQFYDIAPGAQGHAAAVAAVRYFNPAIRNTDHIVPGQLLRLLPLPSFSVLASCPVPVNFYHDSTSPPLRHRLEPVDGGYTHRLALQIPPKNDERDLFWAMSQLQENYDWFATPIDAGTSSLDFLLGDANQKLVQEISALHSLYQRKAISKGQYTHQTRKALRQISNNVGPLEKFLFNGRSTHDALRIVRVKGVPATQNVIAHAQRLSRLAGLAKNGGILLSGVGLYMGCRDIATAHTAQEKNDILMETVMSTATGLLVRVGITFVLATNPVSWGLALVLATSSITASFGAGKLSRYFYDKAFNQYDLTTASGIELLCR